MCCGYVVKTVCKLEGLQNLNVTIFCLYCFSHIFGAILPIQNTVEQYWPKVDATLEVFTPNVAIWNSYGVCRCVCVRVCVKARCACNKSAKSSKLNTVIHLKIKSIGVHGERLFCGLLELYMIDEKIAFGFVLWTRFQKNSCATWRENFFEAGTNTQKLRGPTVAQTNTQKFFWSNQQGKTSSFAATRKWEAFCTWSLFVELKRARLQFNRPAGRDIEMASNSKRSSTKSRAKSDRFSRLSRALQSEVSTRHFKWAWFEARQKATIQPGEEISFQIGFDHTRADNNNFDEYPTANGHCKKFCVHTRVFEIFWKSTLPGRVNLFLFFRFLHHGVPFQLGWFSLQLQFYCLAPSSPVSCSTMTSSSDTVDSCLPSWSFLQRHNVTWMTSSDLSIMALLLDRCKNLSQG